MVYLKRGYVYAVLAALMFGSASVLIKLSYSTGIDSLDMLTVQYAIASFLMFAVIFIMDRKKLCLNKSQFLRLGIFGVFGNTLMILFYYEEFKYVSAAVGTMLLFTYPAMVLAYSILFKGKRATMRNVAAVFICFLGCTMGLNIFSGDIHYELKGILFGLLSAVFYAFMNIYSEEKLQDVDSAVINAYSMLFSFAVIVLYKPPILLIQKGIAKESMIYIVIIAVFTEAIPLSMMYSSIKLIGSVKTSILGNIEIPSSIVLSWIFLSEKISILQITGGILIALAVCIMTGDKQSGYL